MSSQTLEDILEFKEALEDLIHLITMHLFQGKNLYSEDFMAHQVATLQMKQHQQHLRWASKGQRELDQS